MCGLRVPKDCQTLVITQKEELEIIQSCLQCLVDYFSMNEYFRCQLELFYYFDVIYLLLSCYVNCIV